MCRKAHGTAFSTHALVRPQQIQWQGRARAVFRSSDNGYREFCPECGTHLLVHGQSGDGALAIPAGTLDGDPSVVIVCHMYTQDLVSWFRIADDLPQYAQWPPGFGPSPPGVLR